MLILSNNVCEYLSGYGFIDKIHQPTLPFCPPFPFPWFPNRSKISIDKDCSSLLNLQTQFPEIHTLTMLSLGYFFFFLLSIFSQGYSLITMQ